MKGMVFTEFLEMVDEVFSADMVDDIIDESKVESGGAYTTVGFYDHQEMLALVTALSHKTGKPIPDLVQHFGRHLFSRFQQLYPQFFYGITHAFDFLESIETRIHVEVHKLYPDAELPSFEVTRDGINKLEMIYRSKRPFADLALGLIQGCIEKYGGGYQVTHEPMAVAVGSQSRFVVTAQ